ncbi:hypothetical protein AAFF_G00019170 [Aldrovandia affinis]|uniref:Uncharacterized protein n=1 Tax=Aldrovandia affinis TaxID=143900 RepID=A0AAD7S5H2_9TELE|nr:hypothetical protein AAFF_G00019170 [Aldrovandia affinis]
MSQLAQIGMLGTWGRLALSSPAAGSHTSPTTMTQPLGMNRDIQELSLIRRPSRPPSRFGGGLRGNLFGVIAPCRLSAAFGGQSGALMEAGVGRSIRGWQGAQPHSCCRGEKALRSGESVDGPRRSAERRRRLWGPWRLQRDDGALCATDTPPSFAWSPP